MNEAYLITGGNMGDRAAYLAKAHVEIEQRCGPVLLHSALYETAAWGLEDQPPFLNQALLLFTDKSAEDLLHEILSIEVGMGRIREEKFGPRIIDIDILFYNNDIIESGGLQIPHPRMHQRRFVLTPLAEIAPNKIHPVFGNTVTELLAMCPDLLSVHKFPLLNG